ncbi:hypothetical protein Leryth_008004 [Lithospermum erythrorhizon]|nr:hypothetical protein Leryth_008004 [Lithospermum erythrorhizon]
MAAALRLMRQLNTRISGSSVPRRLYCAPPPPPPPPLRPHIKFPYSSKKGKLFTFATIGLIISGGAYASTVDEATFGGWIFSATKLVNPFFAFLDPEVAHTLAVKAAARGWVPIEKRPDPSILELEVWGKRFSNPIGLSAGFDKNAEAVEGLLGLGFGFVEVGSVTPIPQEGNPKPRIFRLKKEGAIINRYGFNSEGIVAVAKRLGAQHGKRKLETSSTSATSEEDVKHGGKAGPGILGVNLGKNKTSEDAAADYVQGVHTLSQYADYLVINVSSPNTPGLRQLQGRKQLKDLVKKVQAARDEMQWGEEGPPPLLVKIAPDLSRQDLEDIAAVAIALRLDGLIISNTTIQRPDSVNQNPLAQEAGGLSGKPLFKLSTDILKEMYILTKGKVTLIGCGGVSSGEDAYKKVRAGATLIQLYTAFAYGGPALIPKMKAELVQCLERDGYKSISEAIGADYRTQKNGAIVAATKNSFIGGKQLRVSKFSAPSGRRSVTTVCAAADPDRPLWFPGSTPPEWLDGSLPGDFGFDPLGLGSDPETLRWNAQAELVHCRWAMLGAAGIFIPEFLTKIGILNTPSWYTAGEQEYFTDTTTLFVVELILIGWAEGRRWADILKPGSVNTDPIFPNNKLTGTDVGYPGGLWFDPLGWGSGSPAKIKELRTKEIKNGRLAMLAVMGAWFQHIYTGTGPIDNLFAHLADPGHATIFAAFNK